MAFYSYIPRFHRLSWTLVRTFPASIDCCVLHLYIPRNSLGHRRHSFYVPALQLVGDIFCRRCNSWLSYELQMQLQLIVGSNLSKTLAIRYIMNHVVAQNGRITAADIKMRKNTFKIAWTCHNLYICSSPRCPVCSHSLLCCENSF